MMPQRLFVTLLLLLLSACTYSTSFTVQDSEPMMVMDLSLIPNATPAHESRTRYGNPPSYEVLGKRYYVMPTSLGYTERGIASWYGTKFHNQRTSSGEPYNMYTMTAAHKTLPLPTYVKVTNLSNEKSIIVKVNDRGPFHENRIIDLSYVAAKKLNMVGHGTALVEVTAIDPDHPEWTPKKADPLQHRKHPQLYLQVGAFSKEANAQRLFEKIKLLTQKPIHIKQALDNKLYKVQIGPLISVEQTDHLSTSILAKGLGKPMTVIE